MIKSMTGFGRCEAADEERKFTVEMKGVNHRYLDANIRMPKKLNFFESAIRSLLKESVHRGKVDIFITYEDFSESQVSLKYNETLAAEYLEKFDMPCQCLKDEEGLEEAGYDVLKSMSREHVCYAEIRFAPLLSETPDMNCNKVIEALLAGLEKGKRDFGVEYGVITCAMRHHSEEENACMLRTAREYLGHGVCAADLAGAESLYPMSEFMELFKKTKALGMPFTLHAGECGNVQNILDSVEAGAGRIGHGIAMRGHADVQKELQKKGIGIEMCPISNLQTKAVGSTKDYPMREFLNARLKVTVNTDNRTVSNTTLTKELEFIQKTYGITDEEIHLMMRNAVDVAFADDAVKERMLKYV